MLVDCMTKQLDTEVFMRILRKGVWSIVRDKEFINLRTKKSSKQQRLPEQPARGPEEVSVPSSGGQEVVGRSLTDLRQRIPTFKSKGK